MVKRIESGVVEAADPVLHVPLIAGLPGRLHGSVLVEKLWLVDHAVIEEDCALIDVPRRVSEHSWVFEQDIVGVEQHDLLQLGLMHSERLEPVALERFGEFLREDTAFHQLCAYIDHSHVAVD